MPPQRAHPVWASVGAFVFDGGPFPLSSTTCSFGLPLGEWAGKGEHPWILGTMPVR